MNQAVHNIDAHPSSWPSPPEGEKEFKDSTDVKYKCLQAI
jgi:hypothetical protein